MIFKTDLNYRKQTLLKLLLTVQKKEQAICKALYDDFKKPTFEAVATETGYIVSELEYTIKNLHKWAKPQRVLPSFLNFPSTDYILKEPYGKVLIIAPWNYPYQLVFAPLIAAVAAGNQVVVKPSELAVHTAEIIAEIIQESFDENHVQCILGGVDVAQHLLTQRWDYIFFTGSVSVGKQVAQAAAEHLTPVTLELGGKNPCIVEESAHLPLAAKRIVWGKFLNAGQTCIAPDYVVVHDTIKTEFVDLLRKEIRSAYGENPQKSSDFPRIISPKHWERLIQLLEGQKIIYGGHSSIDDLYIAPTLIDEPALESLVMKAEIFGPILPIMSYQTESDLHQLITRNEKPLSLYVFTQRRAFAQKIMTQYAFGGGCINDTLIHFANRRLPFGGIGHSGIGAYHGKQSFALFTHHKAVVKKHNWLDIPIRYAPYDGKLNWLKKLLKWFS